MRKRYTRLVPLVLALGVAFAAVRASAAPDVNTWAMTTKVLRADTLAHNRAGATTDSMTITDSVSVQGARYMYVTAVSDGNDTLIVSGASGVLAPQFQIPGGTWAASFAEFHIGTVVSSQSYISNTTKINNQARVIYAVAFEDAGSGSAYPCEAAMFRLRIRSGDTRDWLNGTAATNAGMTGKITLTAYIFR